MASPKLPVVVKGNPLTSLLIFGCNYVAVLSGLPRIVFAMMFEPHQHWQEEAMNESAELEQQNLADERTGSAEADWDKVMEALRDPAWDFRTVSGISKQSGISEAAIQRLLSMHEKEVRRAVSRDRPRHRLYTLKSRPRKLRELISEIQTFVGKTCDSCEVDACGTGGLVGCPRRYWS